MKRKGGLFKKAHELSVLCSVDVAVFIFGNNKKLYEYSSTDMRDLISRYQYHGGPNEHKGPADFNGGDDDDEDDGDGTPPRGLDGHEHLMMPPQFHGHVQPQFPQLRHHTPSASPPIPNGGPFQAQPGLPGHPGPRGTTPQPTMGSRPGSRNDVRRVVPNMAAQAHAAHPGITYMPTPPIYQTSGPPGMLGPQPTAQYPYPLQQQQPHQHGPPPPPPPLPQQQPQYAEDRRPAAPPGYTSQPHPRSIPTISRTEPPEAQLPNGNSQQHLPPQQHPGQHFSSPSLSERRPQDLPPPPPSVDPRPRTEPSDRPQLLLLNTDSAVRKLPQRRSHSIFTPIEENRSILSQHLASFSNDSQGLKSEAGASGLKRTQSADIPSRGDASASPRLKRSSTQSSADKVRAASTSSGPEASFTPPSRSNSLKVGGSSGASRPRGPPLTLQIPDGASEPASAGDESQSPQGPAITPTQAPRQAASVVLPPPSPSASALLSAGASGPPNPFARPPPAQNMNGETPVSALPSRFLNHDFLPSPSSFYPEWNFRGSDSNTLPSPLNFATPVVGNGPSFLRDDGQGTSGNYNSSTSNNSSSTSSAAATTASTTTTSGAPPPTSDPPGATKRKSPEVDGGIPSEHHSGPAEAKRVRVEQAWEVA